MATAQKTAIRGHMAVYGCHGNEWNATSRTGCVDIVSHQLLTRGFWEIHEPEEMAAFLPVTLPESGGVFLDIGAALDVPPCATVRASSVLGGAATAADGRLRRLLFSSSSCSRIPLGPNTTLPFALLGVSLKDASVISHPPLCTIAKADCPWSLDVV